MIDQVSVFLENKAGRLAQLTRVLGDAGINMRALMVADTEEFGVVRIVADRPQRAKEALEQAGFGVSLSAVIAVEIPDRPGGLADVLETLGAADIDVEYAYCFVEPGGGSAVDVFKVDTDGAQAALVAAGFRVLGPEDLYSPDAS